MPLTFAQSSYRPERVSVRFASKPRANARRLIKLIAIRLNAPRLVLRTVILEEFYHQRHGRIGNDQICTDPSFLPAAMRRFCGHQSTETKSLLSVPDREIIGRPVSTSHTTTPSPLETICLLSGLIATCPVGPTKSRIHCWSLMS